MRRAAARHETARESERSRPRPRAQRTKGAAISFVDDDDVAGFEQRLDVLAGWNQDFVIGVVRDAFIADPDGRNPMRFRSGGAHSDQARRDMFAHRSDARR
jgi:hypothetical protein